MILIGKEKLYEFKKKHSDVCSQSDSWVAEVEDAKWQTPNDIKQRYASASILPDNQVVFNLKGNRYRLLVQINYKKNKIVLIKRVGTHEEYKNW